MGVEFYTCDNCGTTFPDCGEYVSCETCWTKWCCDECAEEDGYVGEHCKLHPDLDDYGLMYEYRKKHCKYDSCTDCEHYVPDSCKYCRKEDYTDNVLLDYCMELLGVTRDQLVEKYNNR